MPLTLPETGEWMGAPTNPAGSPIFSPIKTRCPAFTSGLHGAPAPCAKKTAASAGDAASRAESIPLGGAFSRDGWIPPRKACILILPSPPQMIITIIA